MYDKALTHNRAAFARNSNRWFILKYVLPGRVPASNCSPMSKLSWFIFLLASVSHTSRANLSNFRYYVSFWNIFTYLSNIYEYYTYYTNIIVHLFTVVPLRVVDEGERVETIFFVQRQYQHP